MGHQHVALRLVHPACNADARTNFGFRDRELQPIVREEVYSGIVNAVDGDSRSLAADGVERRRFHSLLELFLTCHCEVEAWLVERLWPRPAKISSPARPAANERVAKSGQEDHLNCDSCH